MRIRKPSKRIVRVSVVLVGLMLLGTMATISLMMVFGLTKPEHPEDLNQSTVGVISLLWMLITSMVVYNLHNYYQKEDFQMLKEKKHGQ